MIFTLNGSQASGMGLAFSNFKYERGIYPCVSCTRGESLQINLGENPWRFPPPDPEYIAVCEAHEFNQTNKCGNGIDDEEVEELHNIEDMMEDESCDNSNAERYFGSTQNVTKIIAKVSEMEKKKKEDERAGRYGINNTLNITEADSALSDVEIDEIVPAIHDTVKYLSVIYSRHLLFTLLSKWFNANIGPFSFEKFGLNSTDNSSASTLHKFLKLVAARCYSFNADELTRGSSINLPSPTQMTFLQANMFNDINNDIIDSVNVPPITRLQMLAPILSSAMKEDNHSYRGYTKILIKCISKELRSVVSSRNYAHVNWDTASSVPIGLIEINSKNCWSDEDAWKYPNVILAEWLTSFILPLVQIVKEDEPSFCSIAIFDAWAVALRSCNISIKTKALKILGGILLNVLSQVNSLDIKKKDTILKEYLSRIPIDRITALTKRRISKERGDSPTMSLYLQSLVEFVSILTPIVDIHKENIASPTAAQLDSDPIYKVTHDWFFGNEAGIPCDTSAFLLSGTLVQEAAEITNSSSVIPEIAPGFKVIRGPNWRWSDQDGGPDSLGTVEAITSWNEVPGEGVTIKWDSNNTLFNYRYGGDRSYDVIMVEVDPASKAILKRYDPPVGDLIVGGGEGSFGRKLNLGLILRLNCGPDSCTSDVSTNTFYGTCEWPDYGAKSLVTGEWFDNGNSMKFVEIHLLDGGEETGWVSRFGTETWKSGVVYTAKYNPDIYTWNGTYEFNVMFDDKEVTARGSFKLNSNYLFTFDAEARSSALVVNNNGLEIECKKNSNESLILGTVGFNSGIHYWEVNIAKGDEPGSVFIGVSEKPGVPGGIIGSRLNKWNGWGFVNCRYDNGFILYLSISLL